MRPSPRLAAVAILAGLAMAAPAYAQHEAAPPNASGRSVNLQGGDQRAFVDNAYMHAFYDLSVATLRPGAPKVDVNAYEEKSFAIFRAFGVATGAGAEAMQDHLKLIPRQVVQIVGEDPKVLDSFDNFTDALVGPK